MCFPSGEMEVEILPDGRVKVTTGDLSGPQHMSSEKFLKFLADGLGGETVIKKTKRSHHHHAHSHRVRSEG